MLTPKIERILINEDFMELLTRIVLSSSCYIFFDDINRILLMSFTLMVASPYKVCVYIEKTMWEEWVRGAFSGKRDLENLSSSFSSTPDDLVCVSYGWRTEVYYHAYISLYPFRSTNFVRSAQIFEQKIGRHTVHTDIYFK